MEATWKRYLDCTIGLDERNKKRNCGDPGKRLNKRENGRSKHAQCCSFLFRKKDTSERPIALMPTLIRWWGSLESTRIGNVAAEVSRRVGRYRRAKWRSSAYWTWRRLLSGSAFMWSGLGRHISASQERSCGCFLRGTLSTRGRVQFRRM